MAHAEWKKTKDGIGDYLGSFLLRSNSASSYLNRVLIRQFQKAQIERWQSENASQGSTWKPLSATYLKRKRSKFAAAPGAGNALMVATGRLASGAQARDPAYYFKLITNESFVIGVNLGALPYAKYPGDQRPFMTFNSETTAKWRKGFFDYMITGNEATE